MILRGYEFPFSSLNANDAERMQAASQKSQDRARAEGGRYTPKGDGYPAWLRFQCSVFMEYLDDVLGAGASEKLGLDGSDYGECIKVAQEFQKAMAAEKDVAAAQLPSMQQSVPQNREQRRAQQKKKQHPPQPVQFPAQEPSAAAMVNRVDKQARQKELMRELMREFLKEHSAELYDA